MPSTLPTALAVIDIKTTGLHPLRDGIWEVGLLLVDQGEVVERRHWLLDPGQPLPVSVSRLCGVLPAELREQPRFVEIAEVLASCLQGRVLVGQNLRFAHAFLRRAYARLGQRPRWRQLCTLQLARAVWPQLADHGLDALCATRQIPRFIRQRALPDAEAVWQLLQQLQAEAPAAQVPQQLRKAAVPRYLNAERLRALPERPGVYYFHGENQALLYVGKSRNLRQRVQSHFQNDHSSRRALQMAQQVRDIRVRPTAGELGALLLEAAEVKRLLPLYNRQLRRQRELLTWALPATESGIAPQLNGLEQLPAGMAHTGLFRSRRQAQSWLRQMARERQLCLQLLGLESGQGGCFAAQLGQCRGACCGREPRDEHDARLLEGCERLRLASWPWAGPVALVERDLRHDYCQWHVLDQWRHLATLDDPAQLETALQQPAQPFSLDAYHILLGHLRRHPDTEVVLL